MKNLKKFARNTKENKKVRNNLDEFSRNMVENIEVMNCSKDDNSYTVYSSEHVFGFF